MTRKCLSVLALAQLFASSTSFSTVTSCQRQWAAALCATSGKGFGRSGGNKHGNNFDRAAALDKTYGEDQMKYKDIIIDSEAAMSEFFTTNSEWHPLFRSMISDETAPAIDFLGKVDVSAELDYHDSSPWKKLDGIPNQKEKLDVVAEWLDSVQQNLVELPVNEKEKEQDDLDMHFINEGKRMLAISRFHVLRMESTNELDHRDELFMTCWSELAELRRANQPDTGKARCVLRLDGDACDMRYVLNSDNSTLRWLCMVFVVNKGTVILLPDYDIVDLRRFADMNLRRPLDWLGMSDLFEVSSFERGVSAIRMLHKLSDIPTDEELAENRASMGD